MVKKGNFFYLRGDAAINTSDLHQSSAVVAHHGRHGARNKSYHYCFGNGYGRCFSDTLPGAGAAGRHDY
jgi:hypothetical protein